MKDNERSSIAVGACLLGTLAGAVLVKQGMSLWSATEIVAGAWFFAGLWLARCLAVFWTSPTKNYAKFREQEMPRLSRLMIHAAFLIGVANMILLFA